MTCPKCGLPSIPEQKFCRSCGASLQIITQALASGNAISEQQRASTFSRTRERANTLALWGFIVMFVGAAIGVVGKKLLHEDIVTVVGILMSLAGMFLTGYGYLLPPRAKHNTSQPSQPQELGASPPAKSLPKEREPDYVPSITERTTTLLENRLDAIPNQKESGELDA